MEGQVRTTRKVSIFWKVRIARKVRIAMKVRMGRKLRIASKFTNRVGIAAFSVLCRFQKALNQNPSLGSAGEILIFVESIFQAGKLLVL